MLRLLLLALFFSSNALGAEIVRAERAPLGGAHGLEAMEDGALLIADTFRTAGTASRVYRQEPEGQWVATALTGTQLAGITRVGDGFLVADVGASLVRELDRGLSEVRRWNVAQPWNAKRDAGGNTFALSASGELTRLLPEGGVETLITGLDAPFDLEISGEGVWISEQGVAGGRVSLWELPLDGEPARRVLSADYPWSNPEGLLLADGKLYVAETERGELVEVDADGRARAVLEGVGIPILIRERGAELVVFTNRYQGVPALLTVRR